MKLTALERTAELLDEEAVARHVGVPGVPFARDLLHHQVRIAEAYEPPDANLLGKPEAVSQCFVLGDVVGGGEMDLESILELVSFSKTSR